MRAGPREVPARGAAAPVAGDAARADGPRRANGAGGTTSALLALQRSAGNAAVSQLVAPTAQRQSAPSSATPPTVAPSGPVGKRTGKPIADLEAEFRGLVAAARGKGYPVAADNLEHFLTGGGAKRSVPLGWLRGFDRFLAAETKNHERFEGQLDDKAKALADGGTASHSDFWDAAVDGAMTTELFYASGMSQLKSTGTFTLSRAGATVTITGTVNQRWFDPYNWNPGSSAWIPGHGTVSDDVGLDLKDAGKGHDYLLENLYTQTVVGTYTIRRFIWNKSAYTWSGP